MEMSLEEKVLLKVLKQIRKEQPPTAAPDDKYLDALHATNIINKGWDTTLTPLGYTIYECLLEKENNS